MRILLVEDDPVLQAVVQRSLSDSGHRVDAAADLATAAHWWRVQPFDAVLLDLNLPLDAGADDYLGKPFELAEVEARLRALVRRSQGAEARVQVGALLLDRQARQVQVAGVALALPAREYEVLHELLSPPGRTVSKKDLSDKLSGFDDSLNDNALEAFISRLRKKLAGSGASIRTLRGLGYRIEEDAAA